MNDSVPAIEFCGDAELGYERSRTRFAPGATLVMDEPYRLAHLPLVAPNHPRAIRSLPGKHYVMGRHPRVFSLVLPIPAAALFESEGYRALDRELRTAPFASKIAWDVLERRRDRLHATVCGSLPIQDQPPALDEACLESLSRLGPVHVELRGLFSGNVNVGRLYFPVYPERRAGENAFHLIQRLLGRRETDLYVVGAYNLVDDLDASETGALADILERWRNRTIIRLAADRLWLLGATDDLVLEPPVIREVPLVA